MLREELRRSRDETGRLHEELGRKTASHHSELDRRDAAHQRGDICAVHAASIFCTRPCKHMCVVRARAASSLNLYTCQRIALYVNVLYDAVHSHRAHALAHTCAHLHTQRQTDRHTHTHTYAHHTHALQRCVYAYALRMYKYYYVAGPSERACKRENRGRSARRWFTCVLRLGERKGIAVSDSAGAMVHTELAELEEQRAQVTELDKMKEQCTLLAMQTSQSADELERAGKTLNAKLAELDTVKEQCTLLAKQKDELERTCRLLSEQKVVQEREFQEITSAQEREFQELSSKVAAVFVSPCRVSASTVNRVSHLHCEKQVHGV